MSINLQSLANESKERMQQSVEVFRAELSKFRTGRAHTSLLESIEVDVYGSVMPLDQVASITVDSSQSLVVVPWDKSQIPAVEKAIRDSELGVSPATHGEKIRVQLPPLTQERRLSLMKLVGQEAEKAKVAVRNIRRDVLQSLKNAVKNKEMTEDEEYGMQADIQKITDDTIALVDDVRQKKENELEHI